MIKKICKNFLFNFINRKQNNENRNVRDIKKKTTFYECNRKINLNDSQLAFNNSQQSLTKLNNIKNSLLCETNTNLANPASNENTLLSETNNNSTTPGNNKNALLSDINNNSTTPGNNKNSLLSERSDNYRNIKKNKNSVLSDISNISTIGDNKNPSLCETIYIKQSIESSNNYNTTGFNTNSNNSLNNSNKKSVNKEKEKKILNHQKN